MATIRYRKMQLATWQKMLEKAAAPRAELQGVSPGTAAAELGISRQAVHDAIARGRLEAIEVRDGEQLVMFLIPQHSIEEYKRTRRPSGRGQ